MYSLIFLFLIWQLNKIIRYETVVLAAKGKYTFIRNSFCLRATWAKKLRSFTSPNFSFIIDIALQTSFVINIGQRRKPFSTSYFYIYFSFLYEGTTCETSSTIKRKKKSPQLQWLNYQYKLQNTLFTSEFEEVHVFEDMDLISSIKKCL